MIADAAARAVQRAAEFKPFLVQSPVTVQVTFTDPSYADGAEHLDYVTRIDGRTVRLPGDDLVKAFERFNVLMFLAPVVL